MKEAKGGLAEFLDDTIQLSTIVLLILLEADTKFERFTLFTKFPFVPSNIFQGVQWTLPSCILSRQNESGQLRDRCYQPRLTLLLLCFAVLSVGSQAICGLTPVKSLTNKPPSML
jgi:hypothetical protein